MSRIALIGFLIALSCSSFGQGGHRFTTGSSQTVYSGYPIIKGYSDSDTITDFRSALDEYIYDRLLEENKESDVIVNGQCRFLITFDTSIVKSVEIIESNSDVFSSQVEGILYAMPIEEYTHDILAVSYTVDQPLGCCVRGKLNVRPLEDSHSASKALTSFFQEQALNVPDSLRWLIRTDENGEINCITFSPKSYREWNDLLLKNLEVIEAALPDESGQWIVKYDPRLLQYTPLRAVLPKDESEQKVRANKSMD